MAINVKKQAKSSKKRPSNRYFLKWSKNYHRRDLKQPKGHFKPKSTLNKLYEENKIDWFLNPNNKQWYLAHFEYENGKKTPYGQVLAFGGYIGEIS
jgi:hypothetical protein